MDKLQMEQNEPTTSKAVVGFWHYGVILTYLSVVSTVVGLCLCGLGLHLFGMVCLMISGFCDAFDGVVAKTRKNRTKADKLFGERIDSLSDLVSFGMAPVIIGVGMGLTAWYFMIIYAVYVLAALVRLAYYDVTEQIRMEDENCGKRKYFEGFPVTNVAFIMPFFYLTATMFEEMWIKSIVMGVCYIGLALAFVIKFKMPKPGVKGVCIAIGSSFATIAILLVIKLVILGQPLL